MQRKILLSEVEKIIELLDQHITLFCNRLDFMQTGQKGKAKYVDEYMLPYLDKQIDKQAEKILNMLKT